MYWYIDILQYLLVYMQKTNLLDIESIENICYED